MKNLSCVLLAFLLPFSTHASGTDDSKMLQLGFGTYALAVVYDDAYIEDDTFGGTTLAIRANLSDSFAIHGNFYSIEHEDFSDIEGSGTDIIIYIGQRLRSYGLKVYVGGGVFNETFESNGFKDDYNGLQFSGGIGLNGENIALDFIVSLRDPSDYENDINTYPGGNVSVAAATATLLVTARF